MSSTLRIMRNKLLRDTDVMMIPDYPISDEDRAAVLEYRQALRDLPDQENPVFPAPPGVASLSRGAR